MAFLPVFGASHAASSFRRTTRRLSCWTSDCTTRAYCCRHSPVRSTEIPDIITASKRCRTSTSGGDQNAFRRKVAFTQFRLKSASQCTPFVVRVGNHIQAQTLRRKPCSRAIIKVKESENSGKARVTQRDFRTEPAVTPLSLVCVYFSLWKEKKKTWQKGFELAASRIQSSALPLECWPKAKYTKI